MTRRGAVRTLPLLATATAASAASAGALLWTDPPAARADAVAYLVNVTVRPGYNFPSADAALAYGNGICDKVRAGERYAQLVADVKADFGTADEYQASYLIGQAVGELCPAEVWPLRQSAAGYVPPGS
ncbi:DUF732 domain-containing protein [Mycobacterium sp. 050134]|uniref:DUF732 domain-containing protein n=1 Tax=Mycobacterium sp. 050134 TaxID=3096111 RepID=UPI002ED83F35